MTINYDEVLALIEARDKARDQYNGARRALEKAVWEAREAHDPQPGEAWRVFLPYNYSVKAAIPAIKTATGWVTDPAYEGSDDIEDGYFPGATVCPLERVIKASPIKGEEE